MRSKLREYIKILEVDLYHGLPEEAHSSTAYIKLDHNGVFHEMRIYDKDHYLTFELAYHVEPNLDKSHKPILHYHMYDRKFGRTKAMKNILKST